MDVGNLRYQLHPPSPSPSAFSCPTVGFTTNSVQVTVYVSDSLRPTLQVFDGTQVTHCHEISVFVVRVDIRLLGYPDTAFSQRQAK